MMRSSAKRNVTVKKNKAPNKSRSDFDLTCAAVQQVF